MTDKQPTEAAMKLAQTILGVYFSSHLSSEQRLDRAAKLIDSRGVPVPREDFGFILKVLKSLTRNDTMDLSDIETAYDRLAKINAPSDAAGDAESQREVLLVESEAHVKELIGQIDKYRWWIDNHAKHGCRCHTYLDRQCTCGLNMLLSDSPHAETERHPAGLRESAEGLGSTWISK